MRIHIQYTMVLVHRLYIGTYYTPDCDTVHIYIYAYILIFLFVLICTNLHTHTLSLSLSLLIHAPNPESLNPRLTSLDQRTVKPPTPQTREIVRNAATPQWILARPDAEKALHPKARTLGSWLQLTIPPTHHLKWTMSLSRGGWGSRGSARGSLQTL